MNAFVRSYLFLRRAVGVLGISLPIVVIVGKQLLEGGGLLGSLSGYYYSDLRNVFVGTLCAIGVFLIAYRGYGRLDDIVATVAAIAGIGVALFPTSPVSPSPTEHAIGIAHLVFAGIFFLTLAFFCLFLFTKTDGVPTARKRSRNVIYRVCGGVMLASLALLVVNALFFNAATVSLHPTVWLESLAVIAFGFAWLTKGEALLADPPQPSRA